MTSRTAWPMWALAAALAALQVGALRHSSQVSSPLELSQLLSYSYKDFAAAYGRRYEEGSEEYTFREGLFNQRRQEMIDFQSGPTRTWKMGINSFMDYTEAEKQQMLGYKGGRTRRASPAVELDSRDVELPAEFFVEPPQTKMMKLIRDQGSCGSCWAQAAISTLEGQVEATQGVMEALGWLHGNGSHVPGTPTLSTQTLVSCVKNPKQCGGTGGCGGATAELAYDMILEQGGLPFAADFPYQSGGGSSPACPTELFQQARIGITGYTVLPSNKLRPLKEALVVSGGPIAISVDATNWFMYGGGVFSDLGNGEGGKGDFVVNHAVTLMGYSDASDSSSGYWKVKNSWGRFWGEDGYIRIEMKPNEEQHCGWDRRTHVGIACKDDPDEAWVCGTCGILYDSIYPTGIHMVGH